MTLAIRARARSIAALALFCLATAWAPFATAQQLSIADVAIAEGNSGSKTMSFTVKLSAVSALPVRVDVATSNGTATAGSDYAATSTLGLRFAAGTISKTFTVQILGDTASEPNETFSVNLSNPVGASISDGEAIGTITNDDAEIVPTLSIGGAYVTEGDSGTRVAGFTLFLSAPAAGPVTFDISTTDGSAHSGSDYVGSSGTTQSIPAGSQIGSYLVTINGDTDREPNETFFVQIANVTGATVAEGEGQGQGLIENDDFPPQLWVNDVVIDEGNSGTQTAIFTVTLQHAALGDVTFDVSTSDDDAMAGSDYVAASLAGQTIPAGQTTAAFAVTINGDSDYEPIEYFHFDVSNVSGDTIVSRPNAVGAIINDDAYVPPTISIGNASVMEGDFGYKLLQFPVTFSYQPTQPLYVVFHSGGGTATPEVDYYPTSGGMWISGNSTLEVQVASDFDVESDETITVVLDSAEGAILGNSTAIGTIVNDDDGTGPAEISVSDAEVLEGNSGPATMNFVISLSHAAKEDVHFNTGFGDISADRGVDFADVTAYDVVIPAGQTSVTVPVTVHGDTLPEADEYFGLRIDWVFGAVIGDVAGFGKIIDDDDLDPSYLSIGDVTINEGASGISYATFTVTRSVAKDYFTYFDVRTADITATSVANADYQELWYVQAYIPSGQTSYTFNVAITGDDVLEATETFAVDLTNIRGAKVGDAQAIGTIINDDAFKPTITMTGFSVVEGDELTKSPVFTVTLSEPTTETVSFWASTSYGSANSNDFEYVSTGFAIPAGETSVTIPVRVWSDTTGEPDESFTMSLGPVYGGVCGTCTATGTILNDDGAIPLPVLGFDGMSVTEGNSGTQQKTVTVYLNPAADHPVTFNFATADDTAIAGQDYVATSGSLTIPQGQQSASFSVTVNGDTTFESGEFFKVNLSNIVGATNASPGSVLIINDDIEAPSLSINDVWVSESGVATFTITLSKTWTSNVTVDVATANGTATAGSDYTAKSTTALVIPSGSTSATFQVLLNNDGIPEPTETFTVNLANPNGATIADGQGVATITDAQPILTIGDVSIAEGNSGTKTATFTVALSAPAASAVGFDIATTNGTATAASDYVALSLPAQQIAAGQSSKAFSVTINGDLDVESDETFTVSVSNVSGASVADGSAVGTIVNDDTAMPDLSIGDVSVTEGNSGTKTATFTVSLSSATASTVDFMVSTVDGSATAGSDYVGLSLVGKQIAAGQTSTTVSVTINGDTSTEQDEIYLVNLSNPSGANIADGSAVGTISNDDGLPAPGLSLLDATVHEDNVGTTALLFEARLSSPAATDVTFDFATTDGTATTAGQDYQAQSLVGLLRIPAGQLSVRFPVSVTGDTAAEGNEFINASISNVVGAAASDIDAQGLILNDDGMVLVSTTPSGLNSTGASGYWPKPSADGRYVVFVSDANDLVADQPTNAFKDVYLRDMRTGVTRLVSLGIGGVAGNGDSFDASISADGRFVAFGSAASNLVAQDGNGAVHDLFLRDMQTGTTTLLTPPASGTSGSNGASELPSISADGRFVAFESVASNLVAGDGNGASSDVYLRDVQTGTTTLLSKTSNNASSGNAESLNARISGNGRYVAFWSQASDLVAGDSNGYQDVFVRDTQANTTVRASLTNQGTQADNGSTQARISFDGRYVAFTSWATNLVTTSMSGANAIFVRDLVAGTTEMVSQGPNGTNMAGGPANPSISDDGRYVAFDSYTSAYSEIDTNFGTDVFVRDRLAQATHFISRSVPGSQVEANLYSGSAQVSPDGRLVIFSSTSYQMYPSDTNGKMDIYQAPVPQDSAKPLISVVDSWFQENGDTGTTQATIFVALSAASSSPVTFDLDTVDGLAVAGSDYNALHLAGQVIPAGQTSKSIVVEITNENETEFDENFEVYLRNAQGARLEDSHALMIIGDDDGVALPSLSIGDVSISEGNSGTKVATFTVSLSAAATSTVTFDIGTANGTATAGSDYVASSLAGQTIAAGQSSKTFSVTINGDATVEPNETFTANVSSVVGATVSDGSAIGTITNDDTASGPTLSIADVSIAEGNSGTKVATFTVTLSAAQTGPVFFDIATANGTATAGSDYVAKATAGVRIAAGATSKTFTVTINGDTASESDETFLVNVTNPVGATLADGSATGTITNDDSGGGTPSMSIADVSISEGNSGTKTATFTVTLSAAAAGTVSYDIATSNGTATSGSDYVASTLVGQTISAGGTSKTFVVTINGDTSTEPNETFTVTLSNVSGATLGDGSAIGTITNDDGGTGPTLSIGDVTLAEGNGLSKQMTFTVTLSAAATGQVTYSIATANGTAVAPGDYTTKSLTGQSIAAGATSKVFTVAIKGDTVVEPNETFTVNVTSVTGASVADGQATGTISNDDAAAISVARFDARGLVDDLDDGNRQPVISTSEYATLLLDTAKGICSRTNAATVVGIDGAENLSVLKDLADATNATCANSRYQAVMGEGSGYLVEAPSDTDARGVQVIAQPIHDAKSKLTTLQVLGSGHAGPITVLLPQALSATPAERTTQLRTLGQHVNAMLKADAEARLVLIGGVTVPGLLDLTARSLPAKSILPGERVLASPALLQEFTKSKVEFATPAANDSPAQVLKLQR